jgi:hypothetical protein
MVVRTVLGMIAAAAPAAAAIVARLIVVAAAIVTRRIVGTMLRAGRGGDQGNGTGGGREAQEKLASIEHRLGSILERRDPASPARPGGGCPA